jgi:putative glutamine amidotransferase
VILPVVEDPPTDLLAQMDGLVLTGGGDLDPTLYGEKPDPNVYGIRRDRDAFEAALYREAVALELPILAICRGMQLINVLRGGTLLQEITDHWQQNPADEPSHEIHVTADSALAEAMGQAAIAKVNSYHHQGLKKVGTGLQVTAVCGDVIEAVEASDADLIAVAWHPEHLAATDPQQRALFESFVKRAAATTRTALTRS